MIDIEDDEHEEAVIEWITGQSQVSVAFQYEIVEIDEQETESVH